MSIWGRILGETRAPAREISVPCGSSGTLSPPLGADGIRPHRNTGTSLSIRMMVRKRMALSLCLLLGSCSATRPMVAGPSGPQDLPRYVLVIENTADGQATHAWKPAKDFDLTEYRNLASVQADEGRIVRVSLDAAECERQYDICVPECQASRESIRSTNTYTIPSSTVPGGLGNGATAGPLA
jgi:hypothetical protein